MEVVRIENVGLFGGLFHGLGGWFVRFDEWGLFGDIIAGLFGFVFWMV